MFIISRDTTSITRKDGPTWTMLKHARSQTNESAGSSNLTDDAALNKLQWQEQIQEDD